MESASSSIDSFSKTERANRALEEARTRHAPKSQAVSVNCSRSGTTFINRGLVHEGSMARGTLFYDVFPRTVSTSETVAEGIIAKRA